MLHVVAQLGIGLYMFLVGLDFRSDDFKANAPSAVAVSISGIVVPFLVAIVGTPWLMSVPGLFAAGVSRFNATLFLGAAIAITAFPVLARIIHERGLERSLIGTLCLSAAAIGDARRLVRARRGAREPGRRRRRRRARHRRRHRARRPC